MAQVKQQTTHDRMRLKISFPNGEWFLLAITRKGVTFEAKANKIVSPHDFKNIADFIQHLPYSDYEELCKKVENKFSSFDSLAAVVTAVTAKN